MYIYNKFFNFFNVKKIFKNFINKILWTKNAVTFSPCY